jgi:excisionase family DNA binding protein
MNEASTKIEKRGLSLNEACEYLGGISRPTLYRLMGDGDICLYHINRRRFCLKRDLDAYIENRLEEERYT